MHIYIYREIYCIFMNVEVYIHVYTNILYLYVICMFFNLAMSIQTNVYLYLHICVLRVCIHVCIYIYTSM